MTQYNGNDTCAMCDATVTEPGRLCRSCTPHHFKHDVDCMRRKEQPGRLYLCTCGLTDEQVGDALRGTEKP